MQSNNQAANAITICIPQIRKYKLCKDLHCYAKPSTGVWIAGKKQEIQDKTGIKYIIPPSAAATNQWEQYQYSFWETDLPAGLVLEFKKFYHKSGRNKPSISFRISKKCNPGWPSLNCMVELERLNNIVLQEI